ncbi:MAG: prolipoprotein diacylglyceryl transferase [Rhodobacteraceae bacterium]|jgi:phosphatidylglycerol:prolipoprotein diacylglycerol transferase|uniref:Phosphatidylglycerol--prolipoprotein diacylglyceryl transferase n=1 Tax=Salipiger profundus TaxID=1229727 RepID=A0A1U7D5F8_9RHOB|nr:MULTISPECIES: prolipoprotein diacylglyceryl transferase [Salipiger]APX23353.1 Prolipoprotein diacylglyceryl transferase [Salipiger profundus]MAB09153.1 prolipoprotein diacylglyceryl transferase [Paracoccaceae bacterium]GGA24114.1 prolipoprotein diacylglyceryl transferase [Salipiger profundus]SFD45945.1 Prolipoprotein diacylglyceryl transferase [Salipiger profundus]
MIAAIPFPPLSPELFSISIGSFEFALRWYALAYIVGILLGWQLATAAVRRARLWLDEQPPMTPEQVEQLMTWVILGIILGGRLGFVLFYQPVYYLANPAEIPMIWHGGMSFHGGLLGVIVAVLAFCVKNRIPLMPAGDMIALAVPPGLLLGRLANFVNAELWGRPTDLPWGVIFPGEAAQACGQAAGELCARHPSQLYEAGLEGLLLGGLLIWLAFARGALKRPGMVAGTFFAGYGLARFLVEFVRQPDAQFVSPGNPLGLAWHVGGYGLTMGQMLSLPMILIGVGLLVYARRRA